MKPRLIAAAKWSIVIGALLWLVSSGGLSWSAARVSAGNIPWIAAATALILASMVIGFFRYWLLLRGAGIPLSAAESMRLGFIGAFFNSFLLGGVGGDAVKLVYVMKAAPRRSLAVSTVLVDRVLGLAGLLVLSAGVVVWLSANASVPPALQGFLIWVLALLGAATAAIVTGLVALTRGRIAGGGAAAGLTAALFAGTQLAGSGSATLFRCAGGISALAFACAVLLPGFQPGGWLRLRLLHCGRPGQMLTALLDSVLLFRNRTGLLCCGLLLSVTIQAAGVLGLYCLGRGMSAPQRPTPAEVFLAGPPALVTNCLPVPGGGLGVGEAAFDQILGELQSTDDASPRGGATIFLALRGMTILLGFIGLPFYLARREETQTRLASRPESGDAALPFPQQTGDDANRQKRRAA